MPFRCFVLRMRVTTFSTLVFLLASVKAEDRRENSQLCLATIPQEWFGPDCLLPCRCTFYDQCNAKSGSCGNGTCKSGYSGTSCQYVNAAYNATVNATFSIFGSNKLVDGKLKECSAEDGESGMPLTVDLKQVMWADVITVLLDKEFREKGNISTAADLELTYSHSNGTQSTKLVPQVDPADLDFITYRLLKPSLVSRVQIRAVNSARLALCEISVSSGRNMAVKRGSGVVTDGNSSTCTKAVSDATGRSTWKVSFGHEVVVWRVRLTTMGGAKAANISVNVTFSDGSEKEVQFTPMEDGDLQLTRPEKVVNVTLWSLRQLPDLCEVAVFGDCPDGKFGHQCEHVCACGSSSLICDKLRGDCPSKQCQAGQDCSPKCPDGRYGAKCNETCSTNCRTNECNPVTGACSVGCKDGWRGDQCAECMSGFYGKDCNQKCSSRICKNNDCSDNCSPQCREMCNAASGACKMLGVFTMIAVFLTFL